MSTLARCEPKAGMEPSMMGTKERCFAPLVNVSLDELVPQGVFHFLHTSTIESVADLTHPNLHTHDKLIFAKNETHPIF
jgi:hypothetical protein